MESLLAGEGVTPLWDATQEKAEISRGGIEECSQSTLNLCAKIPGDCLVLSQQQ